MSYDKYRIHPNVGITKSTWLICIEQNRFTHWNSMAVVSAISPRTLPIKHERASGKERERKQTGKRPNTNSIPEKRTRGDVRLTIKVRAKFRVTKMMELRFTEREVIESRSIKSFLFVCLFCYCFWYQPFAVDLWRLIMLSMISNFNCIEFSIQKQLIHQ